MVARLKHLQLWSCALLAVLGGTRCSIGDFADGDPLEFLANLADMPPQKQDAFLNIAGTILQSNNEEIDCNIFGGPRECKVLAADSAFAHTCQPYRADLKVDCVYYNEAVRNLAMDPDRTLQDYLGDKYGKMQAHCPQCVRNLKSLWCAQAAPACGSFKTHVQTAILPAVKEVKAAEDAGQPESMAIAAAVPGLVTAMSKTMACREMCTALLETCSCAAPGGSGITFGKILEVAEQNDASFALIGLQGLGENFRDTLFKDIWNRPLCDVFTPKDDPTFVGVCDPDVIGADAHCSDASFCADLSDEDKQFTETIIATQIARGVFGFVDGPAGLIQQDSAFNQEAHEHLAPAMNPSKASSSQAHYDPHATPPPTKEQQKEAAEVAQDLAPVANDWKGEKPDKRSGSGIGTFFGVLVVLALCGAAGWFGWKKYQEYKQRQTFMGTYDIVDDDGIAL